MKKKNLKTLTLAKKTIAQLEVKNQQKIVGGGKASAGFTCSLVTCQAY